MYNGLWTIEFWSTLGRFGSGVLVLNNGRLLGGDAGHYYSGFYRIENNIIKGQANIVRFDPNSVSVIGDFDNYSLDFKGRIDEHYIEADATHSINALLGIKLKGYKKAEM
ncbi:MAG: hypothetical protein PVJ20_11040 [Desulfobacterales bacterium]|jgi:hypothetical protein